MNPSRPSLSSQAFWLVLARTLGFFFTLALPIVLARIFAPTDFGLYKQAFLIVVTCQNLLPLNFAASAFYFLPRETGRRPSVILHIFLAYLATGSVAFIVLACFPGLVTLLLGPTELSRHSALLGAVGLSWTFSILAESLATANQDVRFSTLFIITSQLTKALFLLVAAVLFRTVPSLLWAALLQGVLQTAMLLWYVSRRFAGWWRALDWALLREQTAYVLPFGIGMVLWTAQADMHSYIVANRFSSAEYAIYAVGVLQVPFIGLLRDSINSVLLARMSALHHENQRDGMVSLFFTAMRKLAMVYLPALCGLLVLGHELLIVMYTRAYEASWPIFALNLLALPISIVSVDAILRAHAEWRFFLLKMRAVLIPVLFALTLAGIHLFGMRGAVGALVFILAAERTILTGVVVRILRIRLHEWKAAVPVLWFGICAACAACVAAIVRLSLLSYGPVATILGAGVVFSAVYVVLIVAAGLIDESDKAMVAKIRSPLMRLVPKSG